MSKIMQIQAKDAVVAINDSVGINHVQSFQWEGSLNEENLESLGDPYYTGQTTTPEATGTIEMRSTGSTSSMLGSMISKFGTDGEFEGTLGTSNNQLIRETDLDRACFDFIELKKANEVFDRATVFSRAFLNNIQMTANADGVASETYGFVSNVLETYRKSYHDLRSVPVTRDDGSDTTVVVPSQYAVEGTDPDPDADWKIFEMDIDGERIPVADLEVDNSGPEYLVSLSPSTIAAGRRITLGSRVHLFVYRKIPGAFPTLTSSTTATFIKADQIDLFLIHPETTFSVAGVARTVEAHMDAGVDINEIPFGESDKISRVQSVDITIPISRDSLKQIKRTSTGSAEYYKAATYPLTLSGSLSLLETDLALWAKIQSKNPYGSADPDILNLSDFENKSWVLVRRDYKHDTLLQTMMVLDAKVSSKGGTISVRGRAEEPYNWSGSKFAIQGRTGV